MKRIIITFVLALFVVAGQAKDKVIERPAFKQATSLGIMPTRVELTKDATIVHFHILCADRMGWNLESPRLEADGKTFAGQRGRILTRESNKVLADEVFEFGKRYEKDARKDSVILYFDPLPKGTKTFDFMEGDGPRSWKFFGIRLDGKLYPELLPSQPRKDDGKPLEPLTLKHGEAKATITMHGESIKGLGWGGDMSRDLITNEYKVETTKDDSTLFYTQSAYSAVEPRFIGAPVDPVGQFPMYLIPGETVTLDIDPVTCLARLQDFAAGKPKSRGFCLGGTIGDINQVLLDNLNFYYLGRVETPNSAEVKDFPEWREGLWQNLNNLRQGMMKRKDYTRRQKDFFSLLIDRAYVQTCMDYDGVIYSKERLANPDSALAHLTKTYTLVDPHAKDLQFGRDGRSFWFPLDTELLPYFEANGLDKGEVYEMTKSLAKAKAIGEKMNNAEVQPDSVIQSVHPLFQPVLLALNDSARVLAERLQHEAKNRIMTAPDIPGDQLLQTIAKQYPGKAVFFDLWATWCGPCKQGIEAMEPLKEKLKGKDVVFVYLTDESSPVSAWNNYVLKVPGKHYRIKSLGKIPGITGIPQYYLYDRQGEKVWEQTGFSDEVLKDIETQIAKALESQ